MVHGALDGDALFFSRDILIEGDTEAVLALRNAVDDAEIDLAGEIAAVTRTGGALRFAGRSRAVAPDGGEGAPGVALGTPGSGGMNTRAQGSYELVCLASFQPCSRPPSRRAPVHRLLRLPRQGQRPQLPGLNFDGRELVEGVKFAHARGAKVLVAINTFPRAGGTKLWHDAIARAEGAGADAVILADIGLVAHTAEKHPNLRRHLSVQAAAANPDAIRFWVETFGIRRVVLPRVLSVPEIAAINAEIACETEVFVFGGLCVMAEGRCSLSSHATGKSPNMTGVCSPPSHVQYHEVDGELVARLGAYTIDKTPKGCRRPIRRCARGASSPATMPATSSRIR